MVDERRAFYVKQGNLLRNARRHNAPLLTDEDLKALGVAKAPQRLSQDDLAKLVGCRRQAVGRAEGGYGYDHFQFVCMLRYVLPEKSQQKGRR